MTVISHLIKIQEGNYTEKTPKKKNRIFVGEEEQKVNSEMKNLSDEKSISEKDQNQLYLLKFLKWS